MKRCLFVIAFVVVAGCLPFSEPGPERLVEADESDPKTAEFAKMLDGMWDGKLRCYCCNRVLKACEMAQALGRDAASKVLRRRGRNDDARYETSILCRMLFVAKADGFRPPGLGAPQFLGDTKSTDWPVEPIEFVDGVPFEITYGYVIGGLAEPGNVYVEYCLKNCDWSKERFRPKSEKELQAALDKLLKSSKWRRPLEDHEVRFLKQQILEK